jgi:general secretion pathway protein D
MRNRRLWCLLVSVLVLVAGSGQARAQDAGADQANALLNKGIEQYGAYEFQAAYKTLLSVQSEDLTEDGQAKLTQYLDMARTAVEGKRQAEQAYRDGTRALREDRLQAAERLFVQAAGSEYLPDAMVKNARAQLAWVRRKIEMSETPAAPDDRGEPETPDRTEMPSTPDTPETPETPDAPDAPEMRDETPEQPEESPSAEEPGGEDLFSAIRQRRQEASQLVERGRQAMNASPAEPAKAMDYFSAALKLDPDNVEARQLMDQARDMVGVTGEGGVLTSLQRQRRIAEQKTRVDFGNSMKSAREALGRALSDEGRLADFEAAKRSAQNALSVIEANKRFFSESAYRQLKTEAEQLIEHIESERSAYQRRQADQRRREIREAERERRLRAERDRAAAIDALNDRLDSLVKAERYDAAKEVADEILRLDPRNRLALRDREWLKRMILLKRDEAAADAFVHESQRQFVSIREAEIPWYELLRYPQNWKELTEQRKRFEAGAMSESPKNRQTRELLQKTIARVNFSGIPFEEVLTFLRDVTSANIAPNWTVLGDMGITRDTEVTVERLMNVTGENLLEVVLETVGGGIRLDYVIEDGIVKISTKDALAAKTSTQVYDIRDLIVPIPDFDGPAIDLADMGEGRTSGTGGTGGTSGGGGGGLFGDDDDDDDDDDEDTLSRREMIDRIINMIREKAPLDSWADQGGPGSIHEFGGQLVVAQTSDIHQKIGDLIKMLREAKSLQVSIEARFVSVSTGFLNTIGVDFDFFVNIGSGLAAGGFNADPFTGAQVPVYGTNGWGFGKTQPTTPLPIRSDMTAGNMLGAATGVNPNVGGVATNAGLQVFGSFLDDVQVDFILEATQAHASSRTLTAPRVTMFNGQQAYVAVGTSQAYVSDLEPVIDDNAVTYDPTIGFVTTGSVLEVRATVSADRRYVTMTLQPQVTTLNSFDRYFVQVTETDANGDPISGTGFIQLPNVTITTVRTTVTVPDGGTLLLGGQKLSSTQEREKGVPMISKIPILNRLYTSRGSVRDENTILIFVKPKIIITRVAEENEDLHTEVYRLP